jgi:hypothetical protein
VIEFPPVPPGEPLVVSATLYMTYSRCPDQALARVRGLYPAESKASFKGGLAHRIFSRHLTRGGINTDDFERVCKEEIGSGMNPKLGALGLKPSELASVIKEVGDLYQRFKALSDEGFRAAEVLLEVEPEPDLTLRGSVDAVFEENGAIRLVDWKTGGLYETDEQLGFYSLLWALDKGTLPGVVEAISIGSGERRSSHPTESAVTKTAHEVANLVAAMRKAFDREASQLERIAGPWCRYCAQLDSCTEGLAAVRIAGSNPPGAGRLPEG